MPQSNTTIAANEPVTNFELDLSHSSAEFVARHLMIASVRGKIPIQSAVLVRDNVDVTKSRIEAVLDVSQIVTGVADRDAHLRSGDFFDVEKYPTMRFASTRIEKGGSGLRVTGDLTIRDVTRPVTLDVELLGDAKDPWGNEISAAVATATIDRKDWGLTWNAALETGGVLVGDKVKLALDLQAIRQK